MSVSWVGYKISSTYRSDSLKLVCRPYAGVKVQSFDPIANKNRLSSCRSRKSTCVVLILSHWEPIENAGGLSEKVVSRVFMSCHDEQLFAVGGIRERWAAMRTSTRTGNPGGKCCGHVSFFISSSLAPVETSSLVAEKAVSTQRTDHDRRCVTCHCVCVKGRSTSRFAVTCVRPQKPRHQKWKKGNLGDLLEGLDKDRSGAGGHRGWFGSLLIPPAAPSGLSRLNFTVDPSSITRVLTSIFHAVSFTLPV